MPSACIYKDAFIIYLCVQAISVLTGTFASYNTLVAPGGAGADMTFYHFRRLQAIAYHDPFVFVP